MPKFFHLGRDAGWRSVSVNLPVYPRWRLNLLGQIGGPSVYSREYWIRFELTLYPLKPWE